MTLEEIKSAVEAGHTVHWQNTGYTVFKDNIGQWLIKNIWNSTVWGLTNIEGKLNDDPATFFIAMDEAKRREIKAIAASMRRRMFTEDED